MSKDPYYKWFQENCKSVDFKTFGGVKTQVLKYLKDKKCPTETKLLLGTWLLKTIYMMYKFRGPEKSAVTDSLLPAIAECKNVVPKSEYLKYHDLEAMSLICLNFYLNRFKNRDAFFILQLLNDTQLVKGYLQNANVDDEELLEHFLSWVERAPVNEQRSNILDVLLRYYPKDKRVIALYDEMRYGKGKSARARTFANDEQNVHDEEISAAVLNVAENLIDWGFDEDEEGNLIHAIQVTPPAGPGDWARGILFSRFKSEKEQQIIECCLQRCAIDTTSFGSGFTIADIFFTTLKYITLSPNKKDMMPIFMEEMDAMKELCASGYVARCMTVLQGQDESGDFDITIPFSKKLHALISMKVTSGLEKANENVVLGTYDPEFRTYFLDYVSGIVNAYLPSLLESNDPKEVKDSLCAVLKTITSDAETQIEWTLNPDPLVTVTYVPPVMPQKAPLVVNTDELTDTSRGASTLKEPALTKSTETIDPKISVPVTEGI